ncbi:MAG: type II toxin-antitoxin system Phd/YefM family antitoxin [Chloroflexi bacterium]|nr:type II toxin-antitoxin system Phd/YefM family antitoxin [Chloroflexota bacterium]
MAIINCRKPVPLGIDTWTLTATKAHLGEVIDRALGHGPQTITRHGRPAVVVLSVADWERLTGRTGTLAAFFAASPLPGSGLTIERPADLQREIDL